MHRFWNFDDSGGERTLYLEGAISDETWWGDEITPQMFKDDLYSGTGDVTVSINSPGGDVFAAAAIYTMLREYPGKITVKISALAASAASVVAMAGDTVLMSPVAMMMIHNPSTIAIGDSEEMLRAKNMLDEVKESIIMMSYILSLKIALMKKPGGAMTRHLPHSTKNSSGDTMRLKHDWMILLPKLPHARLSVSRLWAFLKNLKCRVISCSGLMKPCGVVQRSESLFTGRAISLLNSKMDGKSESVFWANKTRKGRSR
ncbi:MAG: head maturation protease, ClpP-related [Oscillospiraceae bacterium]|jgi:hypothetical protein